MRSFIILDIFPLASPGRIHYFPGVVVVDKFDFDRVNHQFQSKISSQKPSSAGKVWPTYWLSSLGALASINFCYYFPYFFTLTPKIKMGFRAREREPISSFLSIREILVGRHAGALQDCIARGGKIRALAELSLPITRSVTRERVRLPAGSLLRAWQLFCVHVELSRETRALQPLVKTGLVFRADGHLFYFL